MLWFSHIWKPARKEYGWWILFIYFLSSENLLFELDLKECEILFHSKCPIKICRPWKQLKWRLLFFYLNDVRIMTRIVTIVTWDWNMRYWDCTGLSFPWLELETMYNVSRVFTVCQLNIRCEMSHSVLSSAFYVPLEVCHILMKIFATFGNIKC